MASSAENLQRRLKIALGPRGAIAEFIRRTGYSRGAVENWRDGLQWPSIEKIDRIAEALDTTPSALLEDPRVSEKKAPPHWRASDHEFVPADDNRACLHDLVDALSEEQTKCVRDAVRVVARVYKGKIKDS